jgi:histidinol-phosphate aminotransferase
VPTYSLYQTLTDMYDGLPSEHPSALGQPKVTVVIDTPAALTLIASPNAPDGYPVSSEEIARLCEYRQGIGVVVVDEAYVDFTEGSALELLPDYENLIVTRTFSKSFSLAGLRLGFALGRPEILEPLWAVKDSYNLGTIVQALGTAAIEDADTMRTNAARIKATRAWMTEQLHNRGWTVLPSEANFIFAYPPHENGKLIYETLAQNHIYIRYFNYPPLNKGVRISIGSTAEMERLLAVVDGME